MVKREPLYTVGVQSGAATTENSMELPQKINHRTTICFSNSTSGYYMKEMKTLSRRDICIYVHWSIIYNSQEMEILSIDALTDIENFPCKFWALTEYCSEYSTTFLPLFNSHWVIVYQQ